MTLYEQCLAVQQKKVLEAAAAKKKEQLDLADTIPMPTKEDIERAASQGYECIIGKYESQECPFAHMALANARLRTRARAIHGDLSKELTIGFIRSGPGNSNCAVCVQWTPAVHCGWSKTFRLDKRY